MLDPQNYLVSVVFASQNKRPIVPNKWVQTAHIKYLNLCLEENNWKVIYYI